VKRNRSKERDDNGRDGQEQQIQLLSPMSIRKEGIEVDKEMEMVGCGEMLFGVANLASQYDSIPISSSLYVKASEATRRIIMIAAETMYQGTLALRPVCSETWCFVSAFFCVLVKLFFVLFYERTYIHLLCF